MINTTISKLAGRPKEVRRGRLRRAMKRPQRHRLLHGFPLAAAMSYADDTTIQRAQQQEPGFDLQPSLGKDLLVGILPHPFCNPKLAGCGFCTFPHEKYRRQESHAVVGAVIDELSAFRQSHPHIQHQAVSALYFGGGTANLTPAEPFAKLARAANETFDLSQAEISLEGVPSFFLKGQPLLVDILREAIPARHFRISMGLQTFSAEWLKRMGRDAFGDAQTFGQVAQMAHERDMTVSGDLLFNLPGQSLTEMKEDVQRAAEIGLDQICLYHLVLFRGLGTAWSYDESLLQQLPSNEEASARWQELRALAHELGYQQTTLTNFERRDVWQSDRRYRYENMSFQPGRTQMLGFGPSGISHLSSDDNRYGLKTMNPEAAAEYRQAVATQPIVWNRYYDFDAQDMRVFYLTRQLAALRVDRAEYARSFRSDVVDDFSDEIELLVEEALLSVTQESVELTPRGMFFSDAVAGVLADQRIRKRRPGLAMDVVNANSKGHM